MLCAMRVVVGLSLGALLSQSAWGGCPISVGADELGAKLDGALARLADLDIDAFKTETDAIQGIVPCVSEDLSPTLVAKLHRVYGLRLFGERTGGARVAFAAARFLEPDYSFPESLIQEGSPVLEEYAAVDTADRRTVLVREPTEGSLRFDGRATLERSADWPTVLQIYDASSTLSETAYLLPQDRLPAYPGSVKFDTRKLRIPLISVTAIAGVAAGSLVAASAHSRSNYFDEDHFEYKELSAARARTNALVAASGVTGLLAVGTGIAVAVVW